MPKAQPGASREQQEGQEVAQMLELLSGSVGLEHKQPEGSGASVSVSAAVTHSDLLLPRVTFCCPE